MSGSGLGPIVDPSQLSCPTTPVSWKHDVAKLFMQKDIDHMKQVTGGRLDLSNAQSTEIWAYKVYGYVANGYMPPGSPWKQEMVNTFGCWIQGGFQP
jgi:hypothetical protein